MFETSDIDSNLKVIDFGTSMAFKPKTKMRAILGTVRQSSRCLGLLCGS